MCGLLYSSVFLKDFFKLGVRLILLRRKGLSEAVYILLAQAKKIFGYTTKAPPNRQ